MSEMGALVSSVFKSKAFTLFSGLYLSCFLAFICVLVAFAYPSKRNWTLLRLETNWKGNGNGNGEPEIITAGPS